MENGLSIKRNCAGCYIITTGDLRLFEASLMPLIDGGVFRSIAYIFTELQLFELELV